MPSSTASTASTASSKDTTDNLITLTPAQVSKINAHADKRVISGIAAPIIGVLALKLLERAVHISLDFLDKAGGPWFLAPLVIGFVSSLLMGVAMLKLLDMAFSPLSFEGNNKSAAAALGQHGLHALPPANDEVQQPAADTTKDADVVEESSIRRRV